MCWAFGAHGREGALVIKSPGSREKVRPDPTGRVFSATRILQRARLPHAACDTHGFAQSSQCSWPTLYQFFPVYVCETWTVAGGRGHFTNRSATKGSSNTCEPPKPENSMRMGVFSCSVRSSELVGRKSSPKDGEEGRITKSRRAPCRITFVKSRSALFTVQAWAKPVRLAKSSLWNSFTNSPKHSFQKIYQNKFSTS